MIATQVLKNVASQIREFASRATDAYDVTIYAVGLAAMVGLDHFCPDQPNGPMMAVARKVNITTKDEGDYRQIAVRITDIEAGTVEVTEELE